MRRPRWSHGSRPILQFRWRLQLVLPVRCTVITGPESTQPSSLLSPPAGAPSWPGRCQAKATRRALERAGRRSGHVARGAPAAWLRRVQPLLHKPPFQVLESCGPRPQRLGHLATAIDGKSGYTPRTTVGPRVQIGSRLPTMPGPPVFRGPGQGDSILRRNFHSERDTTAQFHEEDPDSESSRAIVYEQLHVIGY